jgi:hypothetical protein
MGVSLILLSHGRVKELDGPIQVQPVRMRGPSTVTLNVAPFKCSTRPAY